MDPILTLTLNPALDITTTVDELTPREKLRCSKPRFDPGGGGINVSRTIKELGGDSAAFALLGGGIGGVIGDLVRSAGIETVILEGDGESRISFRAFENASGQQFRFVLPGPRQPASILDRAIDKLDGMMRARSFRYVVASGSLPPGLPEDSYARLAELSQQHGAKFLLDTSGPPISAALGRGLFLIKANHNEALELADADADRPQQLARSLHRQGAAEIVLLTLGADGAVLATDEGVSEFASPTVEVVSTVGAGDTLLGALVLAHVRGWRIADACRYGVAAAAAAVTTEATELAHRDDVNRLFKDMSGSADASGRP